MIGTTPRELFEQHPQLEQDFFNTGMLHEPYDNVMDFLDRALNAPSPIDYLDHAQEAEENTWYSASNLLTSLSPQLIFENYGEEALVWAASQAPMLDDMRNLQRGLADFAGYDVDLFEKSRCWCREYSRPIKSRQVLEQYRLETLVLGEGLEGFDLQSALRNAALPGVTLSEKRLNDYELVPVTTEGAQPSGRLEGTIVQVSGECYDLWLDAPVGFVLKYKSRPNAVAAVALSQPKELMIYQLQGVNRIKVPNSQTGEVRHVSTRGLPPLDWRNVMVHAAAHLAEVAGCAEIGIQSGRNNTWLLPNHMTEDVARQAYDDQAERLGFTRGADGNWYKDIVSIGGEAVDKLAHSTWHKLVKLLQLNVRSTRATALTKHQNYV